MGKNLYYCKIDGTIYNFKEVQELLQQNRQWDAMQKIKEITGYDYDKTDNIFMTIYNNNMDIPAFIDLSTKPEPQTQQPSNQVHCPYCNSTNVNKISGTKKAMSIIGFGILSNKIGKQWHCNNCKSDF